MLRLDVVDHRRSTEQELVAALRARQPLALAEAYHRTIGAAHACARRLLASSPEVEALLRGVYTDLWTAPPEGQPLEGWARARCFALGAEHLREAGQPAASPSTATLLPELGIPDVRYLDAGERALADLDQPERTALLLAHDRGLATSAPGGPDRVALERALDALAGPPPTGEQPGEPCDDVPALADWVLGLANPVQADEVAAAVAARPGCGARARALRRGRRRIEGLPPTPDMGQRILVTVLAGLPAAPPPPRPVAAGPGDLPGTAVAATGAPEESSDPTEDLSEVSTALAALSTQSAPVGREDEDQVAPAADQPYAPVGAPSKGPERPDAEEPVVDSRAPDRAGEADEHDHPAREAEPETDSEWAARPKEDDAEPILLETQPAPEWEPGWEPDPGEDPSRDVSPEPEPQPRPSPYSGPEPEPEPDGEETPRPRPASRAPRRRITLGPFARGFLLIAAGALLSATLTSLLIGLFR